MREEDRSKLGFSVVFRGRPQGGCVISGLLFVFEDDYGTLTVKPSNAGAIPLGSSASRSA